MATPLSADRLLAALRAEGVRIEEHRSWRTHSRNHVGSWGPVHGVMIHHTVTSGTDASVDLCYRGHSTLPGPLCHGVIAKDGTVHLVGHGRANHAGSGDRDVLAAVRAERPLPPDNQADTDGNRHFYGFEAINLGNGRDPWPAAQVEAIVRASAALCRAHGWGKQGTTSVIGHSEWQPGKIDPRGPGISMADVRRRVAERLAHPPSWSPGGSDPTPPSEEDDVPRLLALGLTRPLTIEAPHVWVSLPFDTDWADPLGEHPDGAQSFAAAGTNYTGALYLRLSGLEPGREIQVRVVEAEGEDLKKLPPIEGVGTAGGTFPAVPLTGRVTAGRKAKVMLAHFNSGPLVIERAELKLHVWKD
ncbi:peptidoglycan recognition family protein [Streptomyces sp. MP131-18]|uniref:peptidoglycan recognition protein family protein n=1 Tax=Streptomyces sp. MP131-18 TaxID=1857892 RepID=UPI00097C140F|nr:peptidoglycan recognition family protein [Streptomyces sp. MP131-18]ONK09425.1 N-acetylmuramoyl-L-alanine amidase [Streptomyces sp. MP131-18]